MNKGKTKERSNFTPVFLYHSYVFGTYNIIKKFGHNF